MAKDRDAGTSYLFWALGFLGLCGMHRFYLDKPASGILYLLTGGLCMVGQVLDVFLIPSMVREKNLELAAIAVQTYLPSGRGQFLPAPRDPGARPLSHEERMQVQLSRLAAQRGGRLTVTDGVVHTGRPPKEIQDVLEQMAKDGIIDMDLDYETGAMVYTFRERA